MPSGRNLSLVTSVFCDAVGLLLCALFLPGFSMNWRGFLIAVGVISLPPNAISRFTDSATGRHTGRPLASFGIGFLGFLAASAWTFAGPAIADWLTPDFNIGGVWQYLVLVAVLFLVAGLFSGIVLTGRRFLTGRA